jgi:hypothetical protein
MAWKKWNNTEMDRRDKAAEASITKADAQADAAHAPSATMRPVVRAATGAGQIPAAGPLTSHDDLDKVQP